MKKILIMIKWILLFLWSYSPIMALTDDSNFGTIEKYESDNRKYRFSLINMIFGQDCFYFISYSVAEKRFELCKHINLRSYYLSNDRIEKSISKYEEHIKNKDNVELEKEFLVYKINDESHRLDLSYNKMNVYTTITLTLFPIILSITNFKNIFRGGPVKIITFGFIVYTSINVFLYLFSAISVGIKIRSTFKDLKESINQKEEIVANYYLDWQHIKNDADYAVSFVKNIQNWFIILFCLLIMMIYLNNSIMENDFDKTILYESNLSVKTINNNDLADLYSKASIDLCSIEMDIRTKKIKDIVFILNKDTDTKVIVDYLMKKYEGVEYNIAYDKELKKDIVKIMER